MKFDLHLSVSNQYLCVNMSYKMFKTDSLGGFDGIVNICDFLLLS